LLSYLLDKLGDGAQLANRVEEIANVVLRSLQVQEFSNDLGRLLGRNLLHVDLDVLLQAVCEEVLGHFLYEVVLVTDLNERTRVGELGLHKKLLDLNGIVHGGVAAHTLDFLEVPHASSSLDVLFVYNGKLRDIDDATKVIEKPLCGLEILEHLNEVVGTERIGVFDRDLNHHVEVLSHVLGEQVLEDLERSIARNGAKVRDEELGVLNGSGVA
jgi:hypothetical protein